MALLKVLGAQSFSLPEVIDRETYDHLMALDADPARKQAFLDSLAARIPQAAIEATKARLDEAIAHAKKLKEEDRVYSTEDWESHERLGQLERMQSTVELPTVQGPKIPKDDDDSRHVADYLFRMCPSYYARDYFDVRLEFNFRLPR